MAAPGRVTVVLAASAVTLLVAAPLKAEEGDYSFWQTLVNLVSPPKADNKVTAAQRTGLIRCCPIRPASTMASAPAPTSNGRPSSSRREPARCAATVRQYKFFVNRVPNTRNTIIYMEGGGACWDYASCSGQTGIRGARNPNGIPDDYMSLLNPGASLVSPFVTRVSPFDAVKTQNWNMVYVPYCTGDIYSGDKVAVYNDPSGAEHAAGLASQRRAQHARGGRAG